MTHTPPIPAGNQSPYPIAEPPHEHVAATPPAAVSDEQASLTDRARDLPLAAIGAAVGLAAALIGGVLLNLRRDKPGAKGKRKAR